MSLGIYSEGDNQRSRVCSLLEIALALSTVIPHRFPDQTHQNYD